MSVYSNVVLILPGLVFKNFMNTIERCSDVTLKNDLLEFIHKAEYNSSENGEAHHLVWEDERWYPGRPYIAFIMAYLNILDDKDFDGHSEVSYRFLKVDEGDAEIVDRGTYECKFFDTSILDLINYPENKEEYIRSHPEKHFGLYSGNLEKAVSLLSSKHILVTKGE